MPSFTLRDIPTGLHYAWKLVSHLKSTSMKTYLLAALEAKVKEDLLKTKGIENMEGLKGDRHQEHGEESTTESSQGD